MRMQRLALAGAAIAAALAGSASASVTVIGGGLAQACSEAVRAGQADKGVLQVCTLSLEEEALRRRDRAGTLVNRGIVQLRLQAYGEALQDFDRAERLHPLIGETFVNRGAVLISTGRDQEALASIDKGIALGVDEPGKAYYNRALAKERLDDVKGAYLDYRRAAELIPGWTLPQEQLSRFTVVSR